MAGAKDRFLEAGERLFRRQGYAATGLKELIQTADAPSGSLYHYFPGGKAELGAEVLGYAAILYGNGLRATFERFKDPVEAVRRLFLNEIKVLERSDYRDGCPIASVTSDIASTDEALRQACATAFTHWTQVIAIGFMRAGADEDEAATFAAFTLSALEGAIILSRAAKSPGALQRAGDLTALALTTRLAAVRAD